MSEKRYVASVGCHIYWRPRADDEAADEHRCMEYQEGVTASDLRDIAARYGIDRAVSAPGGQFIYWENRRALAPGGQDGVERVYRMYLLAAGWGPVTAEDYAAVNEALGFTA